jgi:hypothetical protein
MEIEKYKKLIHALLSCRCRKEIIVASNIFEDIMASDKELKSGFLYKECDLIKGKIIFFADMPLAKMAISIDDIISYHNFVQSLRSTEIFALTTDDTPDIVTLVDTTKLKKVGNHWRGEKSLPVFFFLNK